MLCSQVCAQINDAKQISKELKCWGHDCEARLAARSFVAEHAYFESASACDVPEVVPIVLNPLKRGSKHIETLVPLLHFAFDDGNFIGHPGCGQ